MTIKEKVIEIMKEVKPTKDLSELSDIVEGGYIDSFELMTLITALSNEFDIEIEVDDIVPENFNSIDGIVSMVERKGKWLNGG